MEKKPVFDQKEYDLLLKRFEGWANIAIANSRNLGFFYGSPIDRVSSIDDYKYVQQMTFENTDEFKSNFIMVKTYIDKNIEFMREKIEALQDHITYFKKNSPAFAMTLSDVVKKKSRKENNVNIWSSDFDPVAASEKKELLAEDFINTETMYNDRLLPNMYDMCIEITLEELTKAVKAVPEYWHPTYYRPLVEAFSKPEMYLLKITEPSLFRQSTRTSPRDNKRSFKVIINAEEVAGSPQELSEAVTATRMRLGYGDEQEGERASHSWYIGLYSVAREGRSRYIKRAVDSKPRRDAFEEVRRTKFYWTIVRSRLEILQNSPAYWYLLNYGNTNVTGMSSSDKGGTGKPSNPPTHFVENAEKRINIAIESMIYEVKSTQSIDVNYNTEGTIPAGKDKDGNPTFLKVDNLEPGYKELQQYTSVDRSEMGQFEELNRILRNLQEDYNYMKKTKAAITETLNLARQIKKMRKLKPVERAEQLTEEQAILGQIKTIVKRILSDNIYPLRSSEEFTEKEAEIVKLKLARFAATLLAKQPVPARLYIISKDNVQLRIRTKQVIQDLQDELSKGSKATDAMALGRYFQKVSEKLTELQAARTKEIAALRKQNTVRKV